MTAIDVAAIKKPGLDPAFFVAFCQRNAASAAS
jgi:hypothetical protein